MSSIPRYLLTPTSRSEAIRAALAPLEPLVEISSLDDLPSEPGWILIPPDVEPRLLVALIVRLADRPGVWSPLLLAEGPDPEGSGEGRLRAVPLPLGWACSIDEVARRLGGSGKQGPARLSFRLAMEETSRVRHDINNPLTAAMAEVQLLLMDVEEGSDLAAALELVEDQLRRIRDLVADLSGGRVGA